MGKKTEFNLAEVEELATRGLNQAQIAEYFGVSAKTVSDHKKYDDFATALKRGQAKGISAVANALFKKAKDGDVTACALYLRARAGWEVTKNIKQEITQENRNIELTKKDIKALDSVLENEY